MNPIERGTVVLVNDDPSQLRLASAIMEADGLKVTSCADPQQALVAMDQQGVPDVVVTDICMPGIDGWRFCRLLRSTQYKRYNQVPILILSATFSGADAQQLVTDLGADDFLPAPYKPSELRTRLNALLGGREQLPISALVLLEDESAAQSLKNDFEHSGYSCMTAGTEEEGNSILIDRIPDMVVLGRDLSDEVVGRIVGQIKKRELPTVSILIADEANLTQAVGSMMQGADGFVCEPFDVHELIDLCGKARRERSMIQIEDLLETRLQEVRRSEVKYRLLLNSIRTPIIALTDDLTVLYCNDSYADFFCGSGQELEGQNILSLQLDLAGSWLSDLYVDVLETGVPQDNQGQWEDQDLHAWVYPTPWGILSVVENVTDRKRLEIQAEEAEKLRSLINVAGGVAHGLNDMITTIIGHSQMASDSGPTDGDFKNNLSEIQNAANRASTLARHLTSFIDDGRLSAQVVDLNSLVVDACKVITRVIGEEVEISTSICDEPVLAEVDPSHIEKLLLTVAASLRYGDQESERISIETAKLKLDQESAAGHPGLSPGEYSVLSLSHNGPGWEAGLSTCYDLAEANGGQMRVRSEGRHGSRIMVYFREALDYPESVATPIGSCDGTETVLLVDDEPLVRGMTAMALRCRGYNVLEASNAGEALEIADGRAEKDIRLLLTDITMPKMNGVALASHFKASHPDSRVLLVSGNSDIKVDVDEIPGGHCEFLPKPYLPEELANRVRSLLDGRS